MTTNRAAPHAAVKPRPRLAPLALLAAAAMLLAGLCGSASAAKPIGKDGKIHTCYKVKGKAKGSLRVAPAGKRCKKGWRKLAWVAVPASGQGGSAGATGAAGSGGAQGQGGSNGANGTNGTATLESKVANLSLKLEALEKTLDGVNNGDLTGLLDTFNGISGTELKGVIDTLDGISGTELEGVIETLDGITGLELNEALAALPVLESVCTQTAALTGGLDSVNDGIKGLSILGGGGLLSLGNLGGLPPLLGAYNCPAL